VESKWKKAECWRRFSQAGFTVEVYHWTEEQSACIDDSEGNQRWAVYAYIYPRHPRFALFSGEYLCQPATVDLPLHGGCTYLSIKQNQGKEPHCVKVGADYHHLHDDRFTFMETESDASQVFMDAEALFCFLNTDE
jgi:hypothetical protein